ncbi:MAG: hypothetical protein KC503_04885, partial [Myxococcales bacterium]|nr:hypothetical protein [Myxococcales bacterium]
SDPPPAQPSAPPPAAPSAPPPPPASSGAIKVGLRITGVDRATVQTCFANRLINAGYLVYESTSDVQVQVSGELVYKRAGYNNGTQMVKAHANVRVKDLKSGQLLVAVNKRIKVGRRTVNQAVQLAVSRLCDRVVPKIVRIIRERVR